MGRGAARAAPTDLITTLRDVLRIFDTMVGRKVEFEPRIPGQASMYLCGPTVYDVAHVGHGRTAVVFDTIRRYLVWRGYDVSFVTNVTDVEDKIIARAAREGSTEQAVAQAFTEAYWHELDRLAVRRPDDMPTATGFIDEMLVLVSELVERGVAYVIEGEGVYFAVDRYPGYGELSHRRRDDLLDGAGARVDIDERKRSPLDFALWKTARQGEPSWPSPWGPGRPGWHIECSAMSLAILGEAFDLHGGGDDLVFPHHENERAQAEAAGHRFARYWVHSGMVVTGGGKMAKSLGNFTALGDALDAHDPRGFRLAVAQSHYRSQQELGAEVLADADQAVARVDNLLRRAESVGIESESGAPSSDVLSAFGDAMDDDFGTPRAVGVVFEAVRAANQSISDGEPNEAAPLVAAVRVALGVLGIGLGQTVERDDEIDALVVERTEARTRGDYEAGDRIRDELTSRGVVLEDSATGTTWHR